MSHTKADLRKIYVQKRAAIAETLVGELNHKIHHLLFSRLMMHRYDTIHTYISAKNEPDTTAIIKTLKQDFAPDIFIPKIMAQKELGHHLFKTFEQLTANTFGIPEPPENDGLSSTTFFDTTADILVIVPLLAYDKKGYRVGYGGGYYDRFLKNKTANTSLVGLSFFEAEDAIADTDLHDIPLDFCVSPERVYTFKHS